MALIVPFIVEDVVHYTATYAGDRAYYDAHGDDFQLPVRWKQVQDELAAYPMLRLEDSDFLQAVCLVSTHHRRRARPGVDPFTQPAASCKRSDILDLPLQEYIDWSPQIVSALRWTAGFLTRQGVLWRGGPSVPRSDHLAGRDPYRARPRDRLASG